MKVLIIEHAPGRSDGIDKQITMNGSTYSTWRAYSGASLEDLTNFDSLIIGGGPMSVYEMDELSFFNKEKQVIDYFVNNNLPILGICLGAQLLAYLYGGEVRKDTIQNGWQEIHKSKIGQKDTILSGLPDTFHMFEFHGDLIIKGPIDSIVSTYSNSIPIESFYLVNKPIFGIQFHPEITPQKAKEIYKIKYDNNPSVPSFDSWNSQYFSIKLNNKLFSNFLKIRKKG